MKINLNLSGIGNVLRLINTANPKRNFTSAQVKVTSVTSRQPDANPYNSQAVLTGKPDGPYKNDQTVFYDRRPITEAVEFPTVSYPVTGETTLDELKEVICNALKLISSEVELVDFYTQADSSFSTITLSPTPNSLLYVETFDVMLMWTGEESAEAVSVLYAEQELNKLINLTMPSRGYM